METLNLEILNPGPILADLKIQLQEPAVSLHSYLRRPTASGSPVFSVWNFGINPFGIRESALPEVLQLLGIRSLTLNAAQDLSPLYNLSGGIPHTGNDADKWRYLTSDAVTEVMQPFLRNCRAIAFQDWASLSGASGLWSCLLRDTIKPVGTQGLEFIFYLGDALTRRSFQVEEAIDIIAGFSAYGQVTVALDEDESIKLWMVLNGVHNYDSVVNQTFPDLKKKFASIFRSINIERLLVYSASQAMLFTRHTQFLLARKKVAQQFEMAPEARDHFIEGFCMGLAQQMDMVRCVALGLIVFGSRSEAGAGLARFDAARQQLFDYIDQWTNDLQQPEIMYLYQ
ncbi:hypothetical protein [Dyadobacter aurulentus]|uniref:hypothetical protein n=1 Tax=Dyadobacter sp. UC 10 TaxID=2605428 RepID=UPI0011F116B9|nr:hypothetical protein [Dyadobacter sp. UC 10]KAA0989220.1 hypothetical protein FXO21_03105 [Dyadobacter sp. UC 10]